MAIVAKDVLTEADEGNEDFVYGFGPIYQQIQSQLIQGGMVDAVQFIQRFKNEVDLLIGNKYTNVADEVLLSKTGAKWDQISEIEPQPGIEQMYGFYGARRRKTRKRKSKKRKTYRKKRLF
jgi:hypothetical protein